MIIFLELMSMSIEIVLFSTDTKKRKCLLNSVVGEEGIDYQCWQQYLEFVATNWWMW